MKNSQPLSLEKAKEYCFLLLKFRPRSTHELYSRLKKKEFSEAIIKEVIAFLREKKFIDDASFARQWVIWRLKKPYGFKKIAQELREKGIDKDIIESAVEEAKDNFCEEEIVLALAQKKLGQLRDVDKDKRKNRLYGYLLRRGFSPQTVIKVIKGIE